MCAVNTTYTVTVGNTSTTYNLTDLKNLLRNQYRLNETEINDIISSDGSNINTNKLNEVLANNSIYATGGGMISRSGDRYFSVTNLAQQEKLPENAFQTKFIERYPVSDFPNLYQNGKLIMDEAWIQFENDVFFETMTGKTRQEFIEGIINSGKSKDEANALFEFHLQRFLRLEEGYSEKKDKLSTYQPNEDEQKVLDARETARGFVKNSKQLMKNLDEVTARINTCIDKFNSFEFSKLSSAAQQKIRERISAYNAEIKRHNELYPNDQRKELDFFDQDGNLKLTQKDAFYQFIMDEVTGVDGQVNKSRRTGNWLEKMFAKGAWADRTEKDAATELGLSKKDLQMMGFDWENQVSVAQLIKDGLGAGFLGLLSGYAMSSHDTSTDTKDLGTQHIDETVDVSGTVGEYHNGMLISEIPYSDSVRFIADIPRGVLNPEASVSVNAALPAAYLATASGVLYSGINQWVNGQEEDIFGGQLIDTILSGAGTYKQNGLLVDDIINNLGSNIKEKYLPLCRDILSKYADKDGFISLSNLARLKADYEYNKGRSSSYLNSQEGAMWKEVTKEGEVPLLENSSCVILREQDRRFKVQNLEESQRMEENLISSKFESIYLRKFFPELYKKDGTLDTNKAWKQYENDIFFELVTGKSFEVRVNELMSQDSSLTKVDAIAQVKAKNKKILEAEKNNVETIGNVNLAAARKTAKSVTKDFKQIEKNLNKVAERVNRCVDRYNTFDFNSLSQEAQTKIRAQVDMYNEQVRLYNEQNPNEPQLTPLEIFDEDGNVKNKNQLYQFIMDGVTGTDANVNKSRRTGNWFQKLFKKGAWADRTEKDAANEFGLSKKDIKMMGFGWEDQVSVGELLLDGLSSAAMGYLFGATVSDSDSDTDVIKDSQYSASQDVSGKVGEYHNGMLIAEIPWSKTVSIAKNIIGGQLTTVASCSAAVPGAIVGGAIGTLYSGINQWVNGQERDIFGGQLLNAIGSGAGTGSETALTVDAIMTNIGDNIKKEDATLARAVLNMYAQDGIISPAQLRSLSADYVVNRGKNSSYLNPEEAATWLYQSKEEIKVTPNINIEIVRPEPPKLVEYTGNVTSSTQMEWIFDDKEFTWSSQLMGLYQDEQGEHPDIKVTKKLVKYYRQKYNIGATDNTIPNGGQFHLEDVEIDGITYKPIIVEGKYKPNEDLFYRFNIKSGYYNSDYSKNTIFTSIIFEDSVQIAKGTGATAEVAKSDGISNGVSSGMLPSDANIKWEE